MCHYHFLYSHVTFLICFPFILFGLVCFVLFCFSTLFTVAASTFKIINFSIELMYSCLMILVLDFGPSQP